MVHDSFIEGLRACLRGGRVNNPELPGVMTTAFV